MKRSQPNLLYHGIRGQRFKTFLSQVLTLSKLAPDYKSVVLDSTALSYYEQVFTHPSANTDANYEHWEFLGDVTLNKSVAWYLSRRFPQLNCSKGVKILTRLKINLISTKSFSSFAKQLHFWDFISCSEETRQFKMNKVLEDVFEAFFGVTEYLLDTRVRLGVGEHFCYNIIAHLLDTLDISLRHDKLFDAKTRLKEIFDYFGEDFGSLKYDSKKEDRLYFVRVFHVSKDGQHQLATARASLKADAQQKASENAIRVLHAKGFIRPIPEDYALLSS